jgi:uncharacterized protein (TIGR02646 family)
MLPLALGLPQNATLSVLADLQASVDAANDHAARVEAARREWARKTSTERKKIAFKDVRDTLSRLCVGARRCHYCEDSAADEIEHVRPKNHFPSLTFRWENYLFSCGPCNGPKSNHYGYVEHDQVVQFSPTNGHPPPDLPEALIHPRNSDPRDFLELDLGGTAPNGRELTPTYHFLPYPNLSHTDKKRAEFTIEILDLNRELLRVARMNAFEGFRARIIEYRLARENNEPAANLAQLRLSILATPHLTVLSEMRRQASVLPFMRQALELAPELAEWSLVRVS